MKWKSDSEVQVITQNFGRRCGARTEGDDWNVYWANPMTIRAIFHPESGQRLGDAQLVRRGACDERTRRRRGLVGGGACSVDR